MMAPLLGRWELLLLLWWLVERTLLAMKSTVGEFHHQFSGSEQNDSHKFLTYLLAWLHKDLKKGSLPACLGGGLTSHYVAASGLNSEPSIITIFFQGMHNHVISCGNCQHESVSFEPFTVLSLALPVWKQQAEKIAA